jgi:hypothetical protein
MDSQYFETRYAALTNACWRVVCALVDPLVPSAWGADHPGECTERSVLLARRSAEGIETWLEIEHMFEDRTGVRQRPVADGECLGANQTPDHAIAPVNSLRRVRTVW